MKSTSTVGDQFKDVIVDDTFKQITHHFSTSPVFVKNLKGRFIFANALFLRHCRVDKLEEIVGKTDFDFFPEKLAEKYVEDDKAVLEGAKPLFNRLEIVPNDQGIPIWQVTHKVPLYKSDHSVFGILGTFEEPLKNSRHFPNINVLLPAIEFIEKNFNDSVEIAQLADACNMSVRTFYRRFKESFALTPQHYLQKQRIINSCKMLLKRENSLSEIAQLSGFYDHSHFTREFKKHMHMNPSEFLKNSVG